MLLAAVLVVVLLPATLLALVQSEEPVDAPILVVLTVLFALLHGLSFVAVRRPLIALGTASIVMLALALLPGSDGVPAVMFPSSFTYLLCTSQVAIQRDRRFGIGALVIGVAGAVIIAAIPSPAFDVQMRIGLLVGLIALVCAAWAVGTLQRLRRQQTAEHERTRVQEAIVAERLRINRDLHDVVAHAMTVMIAQAEVGRAYVRDDPDSSAHAMAVVADTGRDALRGMRGIIGVDEDAPREPVPDVDTVAADVAGVRSIETVAHHAEEGERGRLDPAARIALRHAVREAMTNAIRHTLPPRRIDVHLQWEPQEVVATVHDDGGAGPATDARGTGIGLIGMAERVRSAGGTMTASAAEGPGWTVRVALPRADAATKEES